MRTVIAALFLLVSGCEAGDTCRSTPGVREPPVTPCEEGATYCRHYDLATCMCGEWVYTTCENGCEGPAVWLNPPGGEPVTVYPNKCH